MTAAIVVALLVPVALASDPAATIPITISANHVLVPVSVQGSPPFQLILDTAMTAPGIWLDGGPRLEALGLEFHEGHSVVGAGGTGDPVATRRATVSSISLGGLSLPDVMVSTLSSEVPTHPPDIEGAIGAELFQRFVVRVDVEGRLLTLYESGTYEVPEEGAVLPLHFRDKYPCIEARVAVGSEEPIPADLVIDTGAVSALWLNSSTGGRFAPPDYAIETVLGQGIAGRLQGRIGRSRHVDIGGMTFENVVTLFPVSHQQRPAGDAIRDGFVGAGLLTRFDFTVDFPGKRLVLQRGSRIGDPFEWDMTGMHVNPAGERRIVEYIVMASPAEEAGIRLGDELVAVDDEPVAKLGRDGLARAFRRDGVEVRLTIKRGTETIEKRLRLRRLV